MATKRMDRRVRRTRNALAQALLALMQERDFESITIQDITDRADLNRATFYLHYGSKEELLTDSLEAMFDDLVQRFENTTAVTPIWQDTTAVLAVFQHVADHAALYKVLLSDRGQSHVIYRIIDYIADFGQQRVARHLPPGLRLGLPVQIVSHHAAGSLFAVVSWWVQNNLPYSAEFMATAVDKLYTRGILAIVPEDLIQAG